MIHEDYGSPACRDPFLAGPTPNLACGSFVSQCSIFLTLINTIVQNITTISQTNKKIRPMKIPNQEYDFIVIGGGNAGAVIAGRLSEIPGWKVLLIEAGSDEPSAGSIPSWFGTYIGTKLDWQYKTSNETTACLNKNGVCSWPRGKTLGGTTILHGMAYHRGNRKDYEKWVAMGNPDWSWEKVKPYFLKSEDNREIHRVGSRHHATGGPLPVERFPWQPQFAWDILKAGDEMGYGITDDMVGDKILGFTVAQTISDKGVRVSSARSYIQPNIERTNLHILLNSVATKIIFKNKIAVGVQYVKDDKLQRVSVKREVIVSGGAVNSPQLLLLSGIGSEKQLRSLKIPTVHNLSGVGENLHNHVSFGLSFTLKDNRKDKTDMTPTVLYFYNQTGPLSSTGLAQVTGILASNYTTPDDPDVQMFFSGYEANCNSKDEGDQRHVMIIPVCLHTKSRGRLFLGSTNPLDHPIIHSSDLSNSDDVKVLVWGIHVALSVANSPTMRKLGLTLTSTPIPQCSDFEFKSDEYWACAVRRETRTENHQAGSCKMGPISDSMAVVDTRLRVHGVKGIRVVDASVMPRIVSGNPSAVVTMIAERAADFIKSDNNFCEKKI